MKRRNLLIIIGSLIVVLLVITAVIYVTHGNENEDNKPKEIVNLDEIEGYGYTLEDRDTEIFKDKFKLLRDELKKESIDFEIYAETLSELYIIDLYTISNKLNHYDIGGSEYVHPDAKENFELKVKDTIYKYVEDNSYGKREQKLPTVDSIEVIETLESTYTVGEEELDGYSVKLSWEYETDLGYDSETTVNMVRVEDTLYIVSQGVSEE